MNENEMFNARIKSLFAELSTTDPISEEYQIVATNLDILLKARSYKDKKIMLIEVVGGFATNLLGILMIMGYENAHIITTKAFSLLKRS